MRACVRRARARAARMRVCVRVVHVVLRAVMRWLFGCFAAASAPARLPMLRLLRDPLRDRLARPVPLPNQSHGREQMSVGMMLLRVLFMLLRALDDAGKGTALCC